MYALQAERHSGQLCSSSCDGLINRMIYVLSYDSERHVGNGDAINDRYMHTFLVAPG